ncbi:DUF1028 domain-containing protein [Chloroflexi bacterium TSY]|nr:DUF1028 domain-containing protein [Chloroflexi bacterium TSY]
MNPIATFSIVAYDPKRKEWGIGVQSKFLAVGALVPWAQADVGAIATQAYANLRYGPDGLVLMGSGKSAQETLDALIANDAQHEQRQVGIVDHHGRAAAHTGSGCHAWAGHIVGDGFCCQGNILVPGTVEAMATRFEEVRQGAGELADWLVEALVAGQEAGGDSRGRQSAALLVVRKNGGYGGNTDRYLDLRVDDDPTPIQRLRQLVQTHHLYFGETKASDLLPLADVAAELQAILQKTGHYRGERSGTVNDDMLQGLQALVGRENLEERWTGNAEMIDRLVVEYLRKNFGD